MINLRPKIKPGPPCSLTPLQELELIAWDRARKELGTRKTVAKKMGVPLRTIDSAIERLRAREIR